MIKLPLPEVTLFTIDGGVALDLTKRALENTLALVLPKRVLVFSCRPAEWARFDVEIVSIPELKSNIEAARLQWNLVPFHIRSEFMLHVEWDGWVLDPDAWNDRFLECDYIGAPWTDSTEYCVGNGLGLRSARLMKFLARNPVRFPCPELEDHHLCKVYRPDLEKVGFRWADKELAHSFSWERGERPKKHFMFHGAFNWPRVMNQGELKRRMGLGDAYVRSTASFRELEMQMESISV